MIARASRLPKRSCSAGALLACAVLAVAAPACAKDTATLGMALEPPMLDPTAGAAAAIREVTYANLFEGLTRVDAKGEVQPALARSWSVSPDGKVYTFALARNVTFHDGEPFDCSVVNFTYERAVAADSTNAQKAIFAPIEKTECPDPATAVVTLKAPSSNFLFNMGWGDAVMVSPKSAATNKTNPVGTGPFRFKNWAKGDRVTLERFESYWGDKPRLAAVTFRFISDPAAAAASLMAGDVDGFANLPAIETVPQFKADPRFAVVVGMTQGKTILALNNAKKPFDDIRVRRALAYAVDRKALVDAVSSGYGKIIGSHWSPNDPGFVDLSGEYPFDPAKAKALLAEAGVRPGFEMTLMLPPPAYARRGGEVIAAYLAQVGITAKLVPIEFAQWLDQVFKRSDFDATIISHVEPRDIEIYARERYYFNYANAEFKPLYQAYLAAPDAAARDAATQAMQKKLAADEPNVFLYLLPKVGVWNAKLKGMWENSPVPANDVTGLSWAE
jgi:peptide/nickel transport system substrate-binding protein